MEDGAKHTLVLYNCKVPQTGEVAFTAANAKCSVNLKVKGELSLPDFNFCCLDTFSKNSTVLVVFFSENQKLEHKAILSSYCKFFLLFGCCKCNSDLHSVNGVLNSITLCKPKNSLSESTELPVSFLTPLADVHVYEKDEARFELEISREPKSFRWLKGSQELSNDDKFELLVEGKRHTLIVKSARYEDEAKYMFEAEDKRTSGKLIIKGKWSQTISD